MRGAPPWRIGVATSLGETIASRSEMKLTIRLHGQARQLAEGERITLEADEQASVDDLLGQFLAGAPARLADLLADPDGRLRRSVLAVLRDESIDPSCRGLLRDGDEVSLLPPMSGG